MYLALRGTWYILGSPIMIWAQEVTSFLHAQLQQTTRCVQLPVPCPAGWSRALCDRRATLRIYICLLQVRETCQHHQLLNQPCLACSCTKCFVQDADNKMLNSTAHWHAHRFFLPPFFLPRPAPAAAPPPTVAPAAAPATAPTAATPAAAAVLLLLTGPAAELPSTAGTDAAA
jgi:hypothetical protein